MLSVFQHFSTGLTHVRDVNTATLGSSPVVSQQRSTLERTRLCCLQVGIAYGFIIRGFAITWVRVCLVWL